MLRRGSRPPAARPGGRRMITFNCPKCHQALEFKDAAAGRIVRCRGCEAKLRAPGQLAPAPDPLRRKKRRREPVEDAGDSNDVGVVPEWVAPASLLGVGLLLAVGGMAVTKGRDGFAAGLLIVALQLVVTVPFNVAILFIAAPLLGVSFGPITTALLKLSSISVLTLGMSMTLQFGGMPGFMASSLVAPIGWGLFKWLFELEFVETLIVVAVTWLVQSLVGLTLAIIMLKRLAG
jgi:hypothetical protein